jgi:hypothetical protein
VRTALEINTLEDKKMQRTIIEILDDVPDFRKGNAIRHILSDILMIGLLTIICNGNEYSAMVLFAETHEKLLRQFWFECQNQDLFTQSTLIRATPVRYPGNKTSDIQFYIALFSKSNRSGENKLKYSHYPVKNSRFTQHLMTFPTLRQTFALFFGNG